MLLSIGYIKKQAARGALACFMKRWQEDAYNDYGAHYFFIQLIGSVDDWPSVAFSTIQSLLLEAINSKRPQFGKSKPAACLALNKHCPDEWLQNVQQLLSSDLTANWELRYATLMGLDSVHVGQNHELFLLLQNDLSVQDPDLFVDSKRQLLISENRV
jgi:hypothetical protein